MFTPRVMTNYLKLARRCTTHNLWYKTKFITLYGIINFRTVQNQEQKLQLQKGKELFDCDISIPESDDFQAKFDEGLFEW